MWNFTRDSGTETLVSGNVWQLDDPRATNRSARKPVISFGPFPVRYRGPTTIEFKYKSDLGSGRVELNLTQGFVGEYRDDPQKTGTTELDYGSIAFFKDQIDRQGFFFRAVADRSIYTIFLAWVSTLLAYALFRFLESTAAVTTSAGQADGQSGFFPSIRRYFAIRLTGPIAFFYVFFPEYLSDRTRFAKVLINPEGERPRLNGDLFFREVKRGGPITHRATLAQRSASGA